MKLLVYQKLTKLCSNLKVICKYQFMKDSMLKANKQKLNKLLKVNWINIWTKQINSRNNKSYLLANPLTRQKDYHKKLRIIITQSTIHLDPKSVKKANNWTERAKFKIICTKMLKEERKNYNKTKCQLLKKASFNLLKWPVKNLKKLSHKSLLENLKKFYKKYI